MIVEPIPEVPIRYRLIEETDMAFVIDSWIRSYRKRLINRGIDRALYFYGQLALIKYLSQTTKVLVACDAKQPMYIVGWGCAKVSDKGEFQLHYVYVKEDYRQHGVATAIVTHLGYRQGKPIMASHWNENARLIREKYPQLDYNPYLITLGADTHV